jgi:ectoine hydroxylase-related dioxygenase (phytanoyl-CoA dioxygenase family)
MQLTPTQAEFFNRHGYVYAGQILSPVELKEARAAYRRIMEGPRRPETFRDLGISAGEGQRRGTLYQALNAWKMELFFERMETRADIAAAAKQLLRAERLRLYGDQCLYKPPRHGSRVVWHQDNGYWNFQPPRALTMWLALDDADTDNGCMWVVPGSHREEVRHGRTEEHEALREAETDESRAVPVRVPAGCAMMHHCLTLHATKPNESDRPRRAIAVTYMDADVTKEGESVDDYLLLTEPVTAG